MRPIRYGMIGGGPGAFIGAVHRMSAALDGRYELVCGAFSSDPQKSRQQGEELGLSPHRTYATWEQMLEAENARPVDDRMEAAVIVTPNFLHYPQAKGCLEAGYHVICDKPMTLTVEEAEDLCRTVANTDRVFCLTHNYTGYPLVKQARHLVLSGALGQVRKIVVEYSQGWLSTLLEAEGMKQATWRTDPARAGVSSALGDIGTHGHNIAEYVTGLRLTKLFADMDAVVEGRKLEDDATLLARFEGDVRGVFMVSQISFGERNHLRLRVYGTEGALDWCQEDPNDLRILEADGTERILHVSPADVSAGSAWATRLPSGHPEGFMEAFANVYRAAADDIRARQDGAGNALAPRPRPDRGAVVAAPGASDMAGEYQPRFDYPTVCDGARGVHFLHAAVHSAKEGRWVDAAYTPPGERA